MDEEQFINAVAPREDFIKIGKRQYGLLFRVADKSRRGLVSLEDFVNFQRLLKLPDAEFRVAFELFDVNQDGSLSLEEFTRVRAFLRASLSSFQSANVKTWTRMAPHRSSQRTWGLDPCPSASQHHGSSSTWVATTPFTTSEPG